jgi:tetratricopeptide (TPR) repeat protein
MDLHDFDAAPLYYETPMGTEVVALLEQAAAEYPEPEAEAKLLRAYFLAPDNLMVVVALYRFYFYQNRLDDADVAAVHALTVSGAPLGYPKDWRELTVAHVGNGVEHSMGLTRFWLLALKAAAVLALRRERLDEGRDMLNKILEVDDKDRLGAKALLDVVRLRDVNRKTHLSLVASV